MLNYIFNFKNIMVLEVMLCIIVEINEDENRNNINNI